MTTPPRHHQEADSEHCKEKVQKETTPQPTKPKGDPKLATHLAAALIIPAATFSVKWGLTRFGNLCVSKVFSFGLLFIVRLVSFGFLAGCFGGSFVFWGCCLGVSLCFVFFC